MFGTAAVLAAQRRRHVASAVLAACCGLASPLAGVFLGLVAAALLLGGARRAGLVLGVACAAPLLAIAVAFPEKAREPFDFSTFWPLALALAASVVLIPGEERTLRIGAVLYALATVAFLLLDTPMGGNAVRLAALFGGPLLACAIAGRPAGGRNRRLALGLLLAGFAFLQWSPAVRDAWKGLGDPASQASFYRPLLAELDRLAAAGETIDRIEVPFTQAHWDAAEVGRRYPMARGWERQLDVPRNPIFYGGPLNATTYEAWLAEHAVGYVALPASTPDYSSRRERALIERGLPYLREVWRSRDWRLYAFTRPHAVVVPRGGAAMKLAALGNDELTIDVARPGTATVRVHWSPYWKAGGACVERDGDWTRLIARRPGRIRMAIDFAPWRIVSHGRRCA
jgi:hypothetical protein